MLQSDESGKLAANEIEKLITQRIEARRARDFARADEIRDQLLAEGVVLEDGRGGTRWHYVTASPAVGGGE